MNQPDNPSARLHTLGIAVAITTATGMPNPGVSVEDLLDGVDPLQVVSVLAVALHATLNVALGDNGRLSVLQHLGLGAAKDGAQ